MKVKQGVSYTFKLISSEQGGCPTLPDLNEHYKEIYFFCLIQMFTVRPAQSK